MSSPRWRTWVKLLVYKPPQHDKVSFIKRVNVKLFSNALGQLYIYFLVILMYFRFTSGEERLWQSLCKKCPNKEFFWSMFSRIQFECGKIPIRKNSVFGHFSRSVFLVMKLWMRYWDFEKVKLLGVIFKVDLIFIFTCINFKKSKYKIPHSCKSVQFSCPINYGK